MRVHVFLLWWWWCVCVVLIGRFCLIGGALVDQSRKSHSITAGAGVGGGWGNDTGCTAAAVFM